MNQVKPAAGVAAIVSGDDPEALVAAAQALAARLGSDDASKTQIRRLYTTMKQIEMSWRQDPKGAHRELVLLKPRLAYQKQRHPKLSALVDDLQVGITAVGEDKVKLERLVQFFEATLAYYIAGSGDRQGGYR